MFVMTFYRVIFGFCQKNFVKDWLRLRTIVKIDQLRKLQDNKKTISFQLFQVFQ